MPAKSNASSTFERMSNATATNTTPSPTNPTNTSTTLAEKYTESRSKPRFLQTKSEYPTPSRHFTLRRQKRISESRSINMKKRSTSMRKSRSLDADRAYSLSSIQSPLWVTLTNARTIEELSREQI
ncbi:uncharacterized protein [Musca autumnalis]|uniref:uncharacterized protein n=1 Tax=Musca autumnalis TaxID=221902 RepID=UPI003CF772D8